MTKCHICPQPAAGTAGHHPLAKCPFPLCQDHLDLGFAKAAREGGTAKLLEVQASVRTLDGRPWRS